MTGNEKFVVINFEYYAYRARTLEVPKAAFSTFYDDHREVFLKYEEDDSKERFNIASMAA